ncbi:hypothetical protein LTR47_004396 [Exophiala xenobiotica]|nr:hypothetical protein LTR72_002852 [Exophiala xenobiotica]KAK5234363.1 hypothetical protein LTR47_004396 [Exophiala xenobiotica]KAK5254836.1 hypothetical protein LTS06_000975 [Exophiala xenobiotica]KAK5300612.1 hypothetical protein LTR14_001009 [Exophiala xenobiotica]KAK5331186.1 hypothetical protein LTR93_000188 [Exophiala xenobiotica]
MKLQDLSQNTGGQKVIILFNLLLRFGQLVTGVVTIILYSQENGYWLNRGIPGKTRYEFAVGALAILTAIALGLIPPNAVLPARRVRRSMGHDYVLSLLCCGKVFTFESKVKSD